MEGVTATEERGTEDRMAALRQRQEQLRAGWAERNGKQSVNLASISLSMIRKMPVILPEDGAAGKIVGGLHERFALFDRLEAAISRAEARGVVLRRALLNAAFSGQLTRKHSAEHGEAPVVGAGALRGLIAEGN
jgi:hypothetical protein